MITDSIARGTSGRPPAACAAALVRELITERHRQRLSAAALVARLGRGWSLRTLQNYESGRAAPSVEYLDAWAHGLGLRIALVPDGQEAA